MSGISHSYQIAQMGTATSVSGSGSLDCHRASEHQQIAQSYASASNRYAAPSAGAPCTGTAYIVNSDGPGVTTLSVGEEDGTGDFLSRPVLDGHILMEPGGGASSPAPMTGMEVTTLAIGEEDGGVMMPSYAPAQTASYDSHSVIGHSDAYVMTGPAHVAEPAYVDQSGGSYATYGASEPVLYDVGAGGYHDASPVYASHDAGYGGTEIRGDYGRMEPIYSPGEPEYHAFAQGSTGPEVLNFTYIEPVPKPVAQVTVAPVSMDGYSGGWAEPVQGGGEYISVGSYDSFASGSAAPAMSDAAYTPAPAPVESYVADASYVADESYAADYGEPVAYDSSMADAGSEPVGGQYISVGPLDGDGPLGWPGTDSGYEAADTLDEPMRYADEPVAMDAPDEVVAGAQYQVVTPAPDPAPDAIDMGVKDQDLRITTLAVGEEDSGY